MTLPFLKTDFINSSPVPVYRQLANQIRSAISMGQLQPGDKLPPTRDLAGHLGLNRSTVSAAYSVLEEDGLLTGQVGRGSYISNQPITIPVTGGPSNLDGVISFSSASPGQDLFPLEDFRACCQTVLASSNIHQILQLGSPYGYDPLRSYLIEAARQQGVARKDDEILITNGCQQALDLLDRAFAEGVAAVEDPVYPGVKRVFARPGRKCIGLAVNQSGISLNQIAAEGRISLAVVTPNFQNPTGITMPLEARQELLAVTRRVGIQLVENNIYEELRYTGQDIPSLKALDETGAVIQLGSFSKIAFPGLRVGWIVGPKPIIDRLAEMKQACDLHSDQLSQAVLLRFAESGLMREHRSRMRTAGAIRLKAVLQACAKYLPAGSIFTRPEGGMNLWVTLPKGLDAVSLSRHAERAGVTYLAGREFEVQADHSRSLRLSFAGLAPEKITEGLARLGNIFAGAMAGELPRYRAPMAVV